MDTVHRTQAQRALLYQSQAVFEEVRTMQGIAAEEEKDGSRRPVVAYPSSGFSAAKAMPPCMEERLTVRLHKILRSPWAVPPGERYRVIGTVHRGLEFGFLAIARDGGYLQINGSVVQPLNREHVNAAIGGISHFPAARSMDNPAMERPMGPVTVVRKRRRIPADADVALMPVGLP
jgi:hypothetical protein